MKRIKKIAGLVLAMVMVIAMAVPVMADESTYTLTINGYATGHIYKAYQIFKGDLATSEGTTVLSNIEWGEGINSNDFLTQLKAEPEFGGDGSGNIFSACITAADVAKVVAGWGMDSTNLDRFAEIAGNNLKDHACGTSVPTDKTYTISGLKAGYYLVKDEYGGTLVNDYYTKFMVRVIQNGTASPKGSYPTITKTVHSAKEGSFKAFEEAGFGDTVFFKLEIKLPSNFNDYKQYKLVVHDKIAPGFKDVTPSDMYVVNSSDVKIDSINLLNGSVSDPQYDDINDTVTITFNNLKNISSLLTDHKIIIKYSAVIDTDAIIGGVGNGGESDPALENYGGAYLEYSNDPSGSNGLSEKLGKTTVSTAPVYCYQLNITKVDGANQSKKLANAKFKLYKIIVGGEKYASITDGKIVSWDSTEALATEFVTSDTGIFNIHGLDTGVTYYLKETAAPAGYNKLDTDTQIKIDKTIVSEGKITEINYTLDSKQETISGTNANGGIVSISIRNNAGSTLPSTGGIGTTIFYVAGGVLVLAAVVLLVTRKRMEK